MTNDNEIITDSIVVNVKPEMCAPRNRLEKESGVFPAKVKLTGITFSVLQEGILSSKIDKAISVLNQRLFSTKKAIYEEEERKAEELAKKEAMMASESLEEQAKRKALEIAFELEETLAKATKSDTVISTFDRCGAEIVSLKTRRLSRKPQTASKGLMVKQILGRYCKRIGSLEDLYQLAVNNTNTDQQVQVSNQTTQQVANWRSLFEGANSSLVESVPVEEEKIDEDFQESLPSEQRGMTEEALKQRKVIAQIGDELKEIRRLLKGIGSSTPFNKGLIEREAMLQDMLSEMTGIGINKSFRQYKPEKPTEFQAFIDEVIGYKKPLSAEEHQHKQTEMDTYYSNPDVQANMDKLRLQNYLFDMNQPDAFAKISAAERVDNEKRAEDSSAIDLLDSSNEQSVSLANNPPILDNKVDNEFQKGVEEQAQMLYRQNENAKLLDGAEEQAQMLYRQNENARLLDGAEEQAQMLYKQNENARLLNGAEEQAQMLYRQNKNVELQEGAKEQANLLFYQQQKPVQMFELSDARSRYGSLVGPSKPIRVSQIQLGTLRNKALSSEPSGVKDVLVSLKEQLDQLGLGEEVKVRAA